VNKGSYPMLAVDTNKQSLEHSPRITTARLALPLQAYNPSHLHIPPRCLPATLIRTITATTTTADTGHQAHIHERQECLVHALLHSDPVVAPESSAGIPTPTLTTNLMALLSIPASCNIPFPPCCPIYISHHSRLEISPRASLHSIAALLLSPRH
jgi:hypothetical protein